MHPILAALEAQERDQAWLARKTGYSPSLVNKVIKGERAATPTFQSRVAEALRVPREFLFPTVAA